MKNSLQVIGTNDSDCSDGSCDSKALQDTLDAAEPGVVLMLEGTFDFGDDQFVSLKKDITIQGKRGHEGEYLATIKGGINAFALGWDPALGIPKFDENSELISNPNTQRWPAEFIISDLRFEESTWSAITCAATTSTTIKNNQFIGGLQINAGCNAYGLDPPDGSMSAVCFTTWSDARSPVMGEPSDITGHIKIEKNYFDGQVRMDPNGFDPAHGVSSLVHGEMVRMNGMMTPVEITGTEAKVTIYKNDFENIMWGLFIGDNSGNQVIKKNTIVMNPKDNKGNPIGFVWAGISLQNFGDRVNMAPVLIEDNYIYSKVPDFVYGILSGSKVATIRNNVLVLEQPQESLWNPFGDSAGICILRESAGNLVQGNTVKGSGQAAIAVAGTDGIPKSKDNVIENNNLLDFAPLEVIDTWCRIEGLITLFPGKPTLREISKGSTRVILSFITLPLLLDIRNNRWFDAKMSAVDLRVGQVESRKLHPKTCRILFFTLELYEVNKEFPMPSDPEILQDFAYSIRSQEPNTVRVYISILRGFSDWLSQQPGGAPFRPQAITEIAIRSYMEHLAALGRAPRTRSQVLTVLRRFCRWAMSEEYLTHNPANQVKRPTIVATAPRELTTGQRYVLRNRVKAERSWRLSAIFALGYWAGLRISEVAHLQVGHCSVNQRAGTLVILDSKGGKTRTIDLHNEARRALYKYLYQDNYQHKQARDPESAYVFTSQRSAWQRQQGRPDHLSTRGLEYIWTAMKERSRSDEYVIIEDITFHDLRHDFAHRARSAGWGLEEIAVYLGHQTRDGLPAITTTARYTLPSRKQLKKRLRVLPG